MTPKEILRLYGKLCPTCRYKWVYESSIKSCEDCHSKRFHDHGTILRRHTLQIDYFEDYEHETFSAEIRSNIDFRGRALLILGASLPYEQESFDTFIGRCDLIFGRFFTNKRFIGTSLPRYDIFNTHVWVVTT